MSKTFLLTLSLTSLALAACGGGGGDEFGVAPACTTDDGLSFVTEMDSCADAVERGSQIAFENGDVIDPEMPAAQTAFGVLCLAIKPDSGMTTAREESFGFAQRLIDEGVCTGDVSNMALDALPATAEQAEACVAALQLVEVAIEAWYAAGESGNPSSIGDLVDAGYIDADNEMTSLVAVETSSPSFATFGPEC